MGGFPAFLLSRFSFWHSGCSQTPTLSELEGCLGLFLSRRSSCLGPSFDQETSNNRTLLIFSRQRRSFYFWIELAECFSFVSQKLSLWSFSPLVPLYSLKPTANPITFYLRAIWIAKDSGYFLYGVVSSPVKTFPLFQSPPEITAGLFCTMAVLLSACLILPAVGSRAEGDALTSPKGSKSLPLTPIIFLFFYP